MEEKENRVSGFKPEGEKMAVSQRCGKAKNVRAHGSKGNTFSLAMVRNRNNENILEVAGNKNKA